MIPEPMTGLWNLADAYMPKDAGSVFSCFACAGGSTMGYKLAGFDVIGCNEIDPKVAAVYIKNHKPKHKYICSIRDMLDKDLPEELYNLDILDGSPPCTSFSTAGVRDRDWGKEKKFSEGQALQRLDDLFFEFIALAKKLQPKIVIAENVTGMIKGKARGYIKEIVQAYKEAGYTTQLFRLNAAQMGVPQARQRVFFVSRRDDLKLDPIRLRFNEKPITFGEISDQIVDEFYKIDDLPKCHKSLWSPCKPGNSLATVHSAGSYFTTIKVSPTRPCSTLTQPQAALHWKYPRPLHLGEWLGCSSFPMDMDWKNWPDSKAKWAMGMSVPPFMVQRIALEVRKQWLN
jgi:DNA (cytosine-5)-methyltransferase 1